ncbi:MAG TPA: hypothetical protein VE990_10625 [Acidimicrobiales bacterium]|nr:hypothetical protein [Acidimicrobiales bacterium]
MINTSATPTNEELLAAMIRDWVHRTVFPDDPRLADRAATVALRSYAQGAPVSVACEQARSFVGSWMRHPSNYRRPHAEALRDAS